MKLQKGSWISRMGTLARRLTIAGAESQAPNSRIGKIDVLARFRSTSEFFRGGILESKSPLRLASTVTSENYFMKNWCYFVN